MYKCCWSVEGSDKSVTIMDKASDIYNDAVKNREDAINAVNIAVEEIAQDLDNEV